MSDVSALMDKLKSTISYKQFDAPRSDARTWPVLEKMARAKNALTIPEALGQSPAPAPVEAFAVEAAPVEVAPVAVAAPAVPNPAPKTVESSLFDRLQAEGRSRIGGGEAHTGARFARYASDKTVDDAPQALSAIFERIGRKAR